MHVLCNIKNPLKNIRFHVILQRLLFLSVLFCSQIFHACEESKKEIVPFDLTPEAESFHGRALQVTVVPYKGVPLFKDEPRADGTGVFSAYNLIGQESSLYRNRQDAVEAFVATNPDDTAKARYYSGAICQEMGPASYEYFGPGNYCLIHRCYGHLCFDLYAYQAYLLQPETIRIVEGSLHEKIKQKGALETVRRALGSKKNNVVRGLLTRSLGGR